MYTVLRCLLTCIIAALGFFPALAPLGHATEKGPELVTYPKDGSQGGTTMRVLWTVSGYHMGENPTWGKTQADQMLFKPLDITESSIIFDGQSCHDVAFTSQRTDAEQYLAQNYRITPAMLAYREKTMEIIKTDCALPGFSEYLRLRDRRLIVPIHGVLFVFEPAVNY